jgi:DNA-binding response OmpR family regulator
MGGDEWVAVIVEDDPDVRDLIDIVLTQSGFRTVVTEDGPAGVEAVRAHNPLITTLDVNMPGMDGFAVAKRLREFSNTYLIMITALADEIDVVQGFEAGADDYLVKPFRPRELRARADSMLRRPRSRNEVPTGWTDEPAPASAEAAPAPRQESWAALAARDLTANARPVGRTERPPTQAAEPVREAQQEPGLGPGATPPTYQQPMAPTIPEPVPPAPRQKPPAAPPPVAQPAPQPAPAPWAGPADPVVDGPWLRFNGLEMNTETRVATVDGGPLDLARTEFDLLASLLGTGRRVRSKADLVLTMRGQQYVTSYFVNEADKRSVEVHVASIRRKLGDNGPDARYIETVRGVGYRMAEGDPPSR